MLVLSNTVQVESKFTWNSNAQLATSADNSIAANLRSGFLALSSNFVTNGVPNGLIFVQNAIPKSYCRRPTSPHALATVIDAQTNGKVYMGDFDNAF